MWIIETEEPATLASRGLLLLLLRKLEAEVETNANSEVVGRCPLEPHGVVVILDQSKIPSHEIEKFLASTPPALGWPALWQPLGMMLRSFA